MRFCILLLSSGSVTSLQSSFLEEEEWCFEDDEEEPCFLELEEWWWWWWCFDEEEDPEGILPDVLVFVEEVPSVSVSEPSLDYLAGVAVSGWTMGTCELGLPGRDLLLLDFSWCWCTSKRVVCGGEGEICDGIGKSSRVRGGHVMAAETDWWLGEEAEQIFVCEIGVHDAASPLDLSNNK